MSAARPSPPPDPVTVHPSHEHFAVDLATTKGALKGLEEDVHEQGRRIGSLETETRRGFSAVTQDIQKMSSEVSREFQRVTQPKGVQWPMVSVFVGVAFALATWANSYFGQGIAAAAKAAQSASEQHASLSNRIDLISNRQHADAVNAARAEGHAAAAAIAAEKERDRIRLEIDRLNERAKLGQ